ncbi:MAG: hypothetical protein KAR31_08370, partial [Candidatus Omnitrophica bacterium]|nr:hypothetical protein [Candidatus Omnitrophota bacterium]
KIVSRDITDAVHFLEELKTLKQEIGILFSASEAFFSIQAVIGSIQTRFDQLKTIRGSGEEYEAFYKYLDHDFFPFWGNLTLWAKNKCSESGISFDGNIGEDEKILSPSDFGFHNALRDKTGRIVFLDFEHFGWDDPAKTISDFLLHPAMALNQDLKQQFVLEIFHVFKERVRLKDRVEILYPFFGLKWCLIFLNEFIPGEFRRRDFARIDNKDKQNILREQLAKAQGMLDEVKLTYKKFSFRTSN